MQEARKSYISRLEKSPEWGTMTKHEQDYLFNKLEKEMILRYLSAENTIAFRMLQTLTERIFGSPVPEERKMVLGTLFDELVGSSNGFQFK